MIPNEIVSITSGAIAGLVTDSILFPIDTIKTRLQSTRKFNTNLYRNLFSGLTPVIIGSAPNCAVFFLSYEFIKKINNQSKNPGVIFLAASIGEISACLIRCPFEILKQKLQDQPNLKLSAILKAEALEKRFLRGLYRGYWTMVLREIPFSAIQFPIWEQLKNRFQRNQNGRPLKAWQSALCGFCAGGIAAFLTTPLDVAKTRRMIAEKSSLYYSTSTWRTLHHIYYDSGVRGLFFGVVPRVIQISLGGALFLGVYDVARSSLLELY